MMNNKKIICKELILNVLNDTDNYWLLTNTGSISKRFEMSTLQNCT
jgi:hypothetical protein